MDYFPPPPPLKKKLRKRGQDEITEVLIAQQFLRITGQSTTSKIMQGVYYKLFTVCNIHYHMSHDSLHT